MNYQKDRGTSCDIETKTYDCQLCIGEIVDDVAVDGFAEVRYYLPYYINVETLPRKPPIIMCRPLIVPLATDRAQRVKWKASLCQ